MSQQRTFRPYLIQRLSPPSPSAKNNPFTFGGGMPNGGLSEKAMEVLSPIFSFDYMGAAEFEFGDLPKSISSLLKSIADKKAVAQVIEVNATPYRAPDPKKNKHNRRSSPKKAPVMAKIYIIAPEDQMDVIRDFMTAQMRVDAWGLPDNSLFHTKSHTNIWNAIMLPPDQRHARTTIGGIDIQHGWMWFSLGETFEMACAALGIEPTPSE